MAAIHLNTLSKDFVSPGVFCEGNNANLMFIIFYCSSFLYDFNDFFFNIHFWVLLFGFVIITDFFTF
jgi:hypothetical protein